MCGERSYERAEAAVFDGDAHVGGAFATKDDEPILCFANVSLERVSFAGRGGRERPLMKLFFGHAVCGGGKSAKKVIRPTQR